MKYELWGRNEHQQPVFLLSFYANSDQEALREGEGEHNKEGRSVEVKRVIGAFVAPRSGFRGTFG